MACLSSLNHQNTKMTPWSVCYCLLKPPPPKKRSLEGHLAFADLRLQNWSPRLKLAVLLQISLLSLVGPMASAVANPAFVSLGAAFDITAVQASYELAVYVSPHPPI